MVVAYGTLNPTQLIEWIELNKLLGVGEINVCDSNINDEAREVFQHYRDTEGGFVNIRPIAPAVDSWCFWCQKLTAIPCLNDCIYRNMYRYHYTAVIDFDEFLIPRMVNDLPSLISKLSEDRVKEPLEYTFRNAYFFKDFRPVGAANLLLTNQFLSRTEPSDAGYSPKSIVNPRKCLVMQNHHCMHQLPGQAGFPFSVPTSEGLSHHYKKCHFESSKCQELLTKPVLDNTALKYSEKLKDSVFAKINQMKNT